MSKAGRMLARIRRAGVASVRRHPLSMIALLAVLSAGGVGLGGYGWAVYTWRQARTDFDAKRFDDALHRLEYCRRIWPIDPSAAAL